jgi:hypothetical protein
MQTTTFRYAILALSLAALTGGAQAIDHRQAVPKASTSEIYEITHPRDPVGPIWGGLVIVSADKIRSAGRLKQKLPQMHPEVPQSLVGD